MAKKIKSKEREFIKIKDKNLTLEERIYAIPPNTYDFNMNKKYQLEKAGLWEKYDQEFILTLYPYPGYDMETEKKKDMTYVGLFNEEIENDLLRKDRVHICRRSHAEYSPFQLQIVGGCIITSPSFIAVLKSTSGRLKDKLTMVQGHVDYDPSFVLCKDMTEFVRKNAMRELNEEVKIKGEDLTDVITLSEKPKYVINKYTTLIDIEHIGFIYEASMSDEDILKLKSNEKDKHEVVIINRETLAEKGKDEFAFDSWLSDVITMITE
ncbi:hypothetical protein [Romboutsia ilealis]|uniref:hypothetical protein n=1 Tax=Romboutsia ilealis TaxID=1115758 RepID=UPI00272AD721|nr:hypothetical protein [Romboutsia ilealis]